MFQVPDRISPLVVRIEAGEDITRADLNRIATLQALDLVKAGDEFVQEMARRDETHTLEFANQ